MKLEEIIKILEKSNIPDGEKVEIKKYIAKHELVEKELLFKTMLLEAQSETTIDGILVVDDKGYAIFFNSRFKELWKIPSSLLEAREDENILEYVAEQIKDSTKFLQKVFHLYEHREEKSKDEIVLVDGRCFDRC